MRSEATSPERAAFLEGRRQGIGSSDTPAILGYSKHRSPLHVYLEKIGQWSQPDNPAMRWGRMLEGVVARAYEEETGNPVRAPAVVTQYHRVWDWMGASVDRVARVGGEDRILECKTAAWAQEDHWGEPGTDEIPDPYLLQVQHQMAVTGHKLADVAVLIGGQDFRVYTVNRSEELIDRVREITEDFWRRVKRREPPPPDWTHPATLPLVRSLHGIDGAVKVRLGDDAARLADQYERLKAKESEAGLARREAMGRLVWMMGEAGEGLLPDGRRVIRRMVRRKGYRVQPSQYVACRVAPAPMMKETA